MVRLIPATEKTRFDLSTMIQEWVDFLESQCGYEKADFALVAVLTWEHAKAFHTMLHEELGVHWDDIEGVFLMPLGLYRLMERNGTPLDLSHLDVIWSDCFEDVNVRFDEIEDRLYDEHAHGLV
jgi:hypothetical protein